jgi:hypothetical protein
MSDYKPTTKYTMVVDPIQIEIEIGIYIKQRQI